jgi:hypothetical protein
MTSGNQTSRNSAAMLQDWLSLLEEAARCRRLAGAQADGDTKVMLLALAVDYELGADQVAEDRAALVWPGKKSRPGDEPGRRRLEIT